MKKVNNPYKDDPKYITFGKAVEMLGVYPPTFRRYAERFGIRGQRCGTYSYYKIEDIENLNKALNVYSVDILIKAIEYRTGKIVQLI